MQPYFFPYAGYFRLLAQADEFVILDSVQHPRRGRVHRTEIPGPAGELEWLTLPLARQPRDTLIADLTFARGARATFDQRLGRRSWIASASGPAAGPVRDYLYLGLDNVVDYLEAGLRLCAHLLDIEVVFTRSSAIDVDPSLRGQQRILAISTALEATEYLNAPGGRDLYDAEPFARANVTLRFLPPYEGRHRSLLHSLLSVDPSQIRAEDLE
jgi:hypothetical protein